jgi:hypothetical protein
MYEVSDLPIPEHANQYHRGEPSTIYHAARREARSEGASSKSKAFRLFHSGILQDSTTSPWAAGSKESKKRADYHVLKSTERDVWRRSEQLRRHGLLEGRTCEAEAVLPKEAQV